MESQNISPPSSSHNDSASLNSKDQSQEAEPEFRLTKGWLFIGVLATIIGIASGYIMSSFTFAK